MTPGKDKSTFELKMDDNWFSKGEVISVGHSNLKGRVMDIPKLKYYKWYYKILNFLTFRKFFNEKYTYTIKLENYDLN